MRPISTPLSPQTPPPSDSSPYAPLTAYTVHYNTGDITAVSMAAGVTLEQAREHYVGVTFEVTETQTGVQVYRYFSRQDYLDKRCTHEEYYTQYVTKGVLSTVARVISTDRIKKSTDEHFNDIPLYHWDTVLIPCPANVAWAMRHRGDFSTLAGMVCIAKEAARQIRGH